MDREWSGWPLIDILTKLRHCFAHEYGRATEIHIDFLREWSARLLANPIFIKFVGKEHSISQFFVIDDSDDIIEMKSNRPVDGKRLLSPSASIRIILLSFLEELKKVRVVDLKEWKEDSAGK